MINVAYLIFTYRGIFCYIETVKNYTVGIFQYYGEPLCDVNANKERMKGNDDERKS